MFTVYVSLLLYADVVVVICINVVMLRVDFVVACLGAVIICASVAIRPAGVIITYKYYYSMC